MKKYLLRIGSSDAMESVYDADGDLLSIKFDETTNAIQRNWFLSLIGVRYEGLLNIYQKVKEKGVECELVEIPSNLSFDAFWEAYAYKVGKKERVKKKWDAMPESERTKALAHIKKYNYFLSERPHMERKYAETYLNCQEWNN